MLASLTTLAIGTRPVGMSNVPSDNAIKRPITAALQPSVPSLGIILLGSLSSIGMVFVGRLTSAIPRHLLGDQVDIELLLWHCFYIEEFYTC